MQSIDIALLSQDLTTQISLIINQEISAEEIAEQQYALIEQLNPHFNAFLSLDESVLDEVGDAMGPFYGLTVAVKDNIAVAELPLTNGLGSRINEYPEDDALAVARLKDAGAGISGKLNMQAGALGATNHNEDFGNCHNPYQLGYTPGGSSGGSAVAVSACLAPVALGSDTMGSVRIPASYCGLFGFKPSHGAISNHGLIPCNNDFDTIGVLSRSADDLALLLDIMVAEDLDRVESAKYEFNSDLPANPKLVIPDDLTALGIEQGIIADFNENLKTFTAMGCELIPVSFKSLDFSAARRAGLLLCEAQMLADVGSEEQLTDYPAQLQQMLNYAAGKSALDLVSAQRQIEQVKIQLQQWLSLGDFVFLPTTKQRAFSFEQTAPVEQADLTALANFAGVPALSIPMKTSQNLPAGMQLIGCKGDDFKLISLAEKWQQQSGYEFILPPEVAKILGV